MHTRTHHTLTTLHHTTLHTTHTHTHTQQKLLYNGTCIPITKISLKQKQKQNKKTKTKRQEQNRNINIARVCSWWKCCFTSTGTVGLLGTGAQDVHLDFHTAPELCCEFLFCFSLYIQFLCSLYY